MAKKNFETALAKLDRITSELEEGELSLDNSLKKFDEGMQLIRFCNQRLDDSQKKIDILMGNDDTLASVPFDSKDE